MIDQADFVDALLAAPLGVCLLAHLEASANGDSVGASWQAPTNQRRVAHAVDALGSMSLGTLVEAATFTGEIGSGPWIGEAPANIAAGYRNAEARAPIAKAIAERFGTALEAPIDRRAQTWWTDGHAWPRSPPFTDYEHVYGAGEFTWAGLWTTTDPPEAIRQMADAWEFDGGELQHRALPARPLARVFEIHRPSDWARLVTEYSRPADPHPGWELPGVNQRSSWLTPLTQLPHQRAVRTSIGRHLVPDWSLVAADVDGVHLTWAGLITTEGTITDLGDGAVTMLRYWFSERTHWLNDVFEEPVGR